MENLVSDEQCRKILASVDPGYTLDSYQIKPLEQETMGGLIGLHYKLYVQYKKNDKKDKLQYFLKTLNKRSKTMYRLSTDLRMFRKESLFYMTILPLFQDEGIDVSFAPWGYLCENDVVVMEDLSLSKFKLFPKTESLDLEHCYGCLTALAKFHMSSILYEIHASKNLGAKYSLFDDYSDILKNFAFSVDDNYGANLMERAVEAILELAKLEFVENDEYQNFENNLNTVLSNQDENSEFRKCLLHSDLWSNNFLHKYEKNKVVDTKLIDFQLLNYGPPVSDVLHFIYSNTRKQFRDEHIDTLLNYYYNKLKELLYDRNLFIEDILPEEEYFRSYETFKISEKLHSLIDRCLTCLPDEVYYDVINIEENLEKFIFEERGKYLISPYQNISQYRDIISEDLKELREMVSRSI